MKTKALIENLLAGSFIMQRPNRRKGFGYALYKQKGVPYEAISDIQLATFKNVTKNNNGIITLNLNLVRQQHGNSLVKTLYKQSRAKIKNHDNAQAVNSAGIPNT